MSRGPTRVISIRLTLDEARALDDQAADLDMSRSALVALVATRGRIEKAFGKGVGCPLCAKAKQGKKAK